MLKFHEQETCEGIIQHLELREGVKRSDVHVRDVGSDTPPGARVEMTFRLGDQLYAIEHTGLEPFEGFMAHQNRSPDLFAPIEAGVTAALGAFLASGVVIEMHMPIDAFTGRKMREVRALQAALIEHVSISAPTLPVSLYADYRGTLMTAQPVGVPFQVSLIRFEGFRGLPGRFQLKHLAGSGQPRAPRIQRSCNDKFPKLAAWKCSDNARTILVLEDNDIYLTNQIIVADTFLPIARARADAPDETYMVSTCTQPWYAWPILVNGRSYFDLAAISHPIHFEMEAGGN
ncbi:hypothetical protein [Bradyrhizobium oligotrophicum]|uniref:hypothetical protein n=1 Tax=Bradyrhizobium oligotrophicum TaxID=44255 RepID=UPI003EB7F8BB